MYHDDMNPKLSLLYLVLLVLGFGIGFLVSKNKYEKICVSSKFTYINQQLGCGPAYVVDKRSYIQLKNQLEKVISEKTEAGEVTDVSIYFRDLQDGPTLGIREHENFSPASLLKLPLLLTYYNRQENQPDLFERQVMVKKLDNNLDQIVAPKASIKENTTYSIGELLKYMIVYSDNHAYYVLREYVRQLSPDKDLLKGTFVDLGILDPQGFLDDTLSVKSYASIFVQLYHSSYLNKKELSENVLALLAQVDWNKGINAGVPIGIHVAHKFGERGNSEGGIQQLHDCGIVYYPDNPYVLCVMTRGKDLNKLTDMIALISKMVYAEFDSRTL